MTEFCNTFGMFLKQYGFPGASLGFAFFLVLRIIKSSDKREVAATETHKMFAENIQNMANVHKANAIQLAGDVRARAVEARDFQKFVREEHMQMMRDQQKFGMQMDEVTKSLGRINGFRKE